MMVTSRAEIHTYHDKKGIVRHVTNDILEDAARIKDELVKANGKCNFHKLRRMLIEDGADKNDVKYCQGFNNLVKKYNYRYYHNNNSRANSPAESAHVPNAVHTAIGRYNYAKRESQNYARGYNRLRRHVTDTQILRDQIDHALSHAVFDFKVNQKPAAKKATGDNALLASFADLHVGALVNIPQNHYNLNIAKQRVSEYAKKLVQIALLDKCSDVYIANIGDDVEQVYMRFTQSFDTELDMSDQIVQAINIIDGFLVYMYNELSRFGVKLHYTGIGGNHDRLNGNKKNSLYKDSVATIVNAGVEGLAHTLFDKKYFEYIKPDDIYRTHLKIRGENVKIVHGDLDNLNNADTLGNMSLTDGRSYKLLLGGHLHRYSVYEAGFNKYIVTSGSFKGSDDYSSKLGRISSVSQAAVVISPKLGMSVRNVELH